MRQMRTCIGASIGTLVALFLFKQFTDTFEQLGRRIILLDNVPQGDEKQNEFKCVLTSTKPDFEICVFDPKIDIYISASIIKDGMWDFYITRAFQAILSTYSEATLIDCGANIGYYSLLAARMGHQVISVEPYKNSRSRLLQGIGKNNLIDKITVVRNAISDRNIFVELVENRNNKGGVSIKMIEGVETITNKDYASRIQTITLDDLIPLIQKKTVVLKLDIEGYECKALANTRRLFTQVNVTFILMEWKKMFANRWKLNSPCSNFALKRLVNDLISKGYVAHEAHSGIALDPRDSITNWRMGDLFWRHKDSKWPKLTT